MKLKHFELPPFLVPFFVFLLGLPFVQAQRLAGGWAHSAFICSDSSMMTAGYNAYGQLGNGSFTDSNVPVGVSNLTGAIAVGAGWFHSIALKSDSTVWCWGRNADGQLGDGTNANRNIPTLVNSLSGIIAIASGVNHNLAVKSDSTVWAWGNNTYGQLGDNTTVNSNVPVSVLNLTSVIDVAGGSWHSLALRSDSTVWAWGNNASGELGDGTNNLSYVPVQVVSLTGVIAISGGQHFSLALKSDGTVWAWGQNSFYQLGNGSSAASNVPVQVSNLSDVNGISKGSFQLHSLATKNDGSLWIWGNNSYGELGNGTTTNSSVPILVNGLNSPVETSAGNVHSLSLHADGTVWAWGWNLYGQLGIASNADAYTPQQITSLCQMPMMVPVAAFGSPASICPGICVGFINLSLNATSFEWSFPGASPATSTDVSPQNICYANPGVYDVQLIAGSSLGSDTLLLPGFITVFPYPSAQGISQSGDTLFANPGSASYQWYQNGTLIPGATDYFYLALSGGDYNVVATDSNGCEVEAAIFDVIASLAEPRNELHLTGSPNPAINQFAVYSNNLSDIAGKRFLVYDATGRHVLCPVEITSGGPGAQALVDVSLLSPGLYLLKVWDKNKSSILKFIKN